MCIYVWYDIVIIATVVNSTDQIEYEKSYRGEMHSLPQSFSKLLRARWLVGEDWRVKLKLRQSKVTKANREFDTIDPKEQKQTQL